MRIALAGNANAGKTTLFNALSGTEARTGNYGGVTVEQCRAPLQPVARGEQSSGALQAPLLIDLPGAISLTARSHDEAETQRILLGAGGRQCDAILYVLDACQLGRGLYFCIQLLEMGLPMVVALHRIDAAKRRGFTVDVAALADHLQAPVVPCSAHTGEGVDALRRALWALPPLETHPRRPHALPGAIAPHERDVLRELAAALMAPGGYEGPNSEAVALWLVSTREGSEQPRLPALQAQAVAAARARLAAEPADLPLGQRVIRARFAAVDEVVRATVQQSGSGLAPSAQLDRWLLHPIAGAGTLAVALFFVFQLAFAFAEPAVQAVEWTTELLQGGVAHVVPAGLMRSLLVDGLLAGLGNVLAFVPQIGMLFFALGLLEESGYMARAALLLDRAMRGVGLSGRSFIPLMSSFGCAIPGIMATRTISDRGQALRTMLVAPLMSCSARLPAYTLVIGAVFSAVPPLGGLVSAGGVIIFAMYALGFLAALGTAKLLQWIWPYEARPRPLILELPEYARPRLRRVAASATGKAMQFVRSNGPTILVLSVVLWAFMTFPRGTEPPPHELAGGDRAAAQAQQRAATDGDVGPAAQELAALRAWHLENSFAGRLGHLIEPALRPIGLDWRIGIGLIASVAAREVLVSTLAQVYALGDADEGGQPLGLRDALANQRRPDGTPQFGVLEGLSLLVFFVLALQCLSTVAILRRESGGWRWPLAALVYMNALAYVASFVVYQGGKLLLMG